MLSTTLNAEITAQARASLSGRWNFVATATLISIIISMLINLIPLIGLFAPLFISGAFTLGFVIIYLKISRDEGDEDVKYSHIFSGFNDYIRAFLAYLLTIIFTLLWTLLLIIPGIIAAYSYMLTFFVLADNKSLTALEAMHESKEMMKGYKLKAFYLSFRFFGWAILSTLTLGIGLLWLIPYIGMSFTKFYEDIKESETAEERYVRKESAPHISTKKQNKESTESILNNIRAKNQQMKS